MTQITEIAVTIEDGKKAVEEYAPARKASVTIKASVGEGQDGEVVLENIRRIADQKVHEIINNKPAKPVPKVAAVDAGASSPSAPSSETSAPSTAAASPEPEKPKATRGKGKTKDDLAQEAGIPVDSDPLGLGIQALPAEPAPPPPAEVTDLDLANAVSKKVTALGNTPEAVTKLTALLVEFGGRPAPKQARDIPQARRPEFLARLDALK